jgi:ATP-dependent DNA helicase RecQ
MGLIDVRFVIHHDIPKSLDIIRNRSCWKGWWRRTLSCLLFLKDVEKLEKFMSGKPVAEQEIGFFIAGSSLRRNFNVKKILLHYFGEEFDSETGEGADMDDNVRNPK